MKSILVVCHDAGGAEVVSAWVKQHDAHRCLFLLEGPALAIFRRKLGNFQTVSRDAIIKIFPEIDLVLTGTGWGSDLEKRLIALARERGVRVASFLDHWVEYPERFLLAGAMVLPDEIWVGDRYADTLARAAFPGCEVKLQTNYYFAEMVQEVKRYSAAVEASRDRVRVLYVCEPLAAAAQAKHGDSRYYGYTEFEALDGCLEYLQKQAPAIERVRLRLHPAEAPGKYEEIIRRYREALNIEESQGSRLSEDCAWADWLVGCQSMALVIGVLAGKRVFCCIPPGGKPSPLPYAEIVALFPQKEMPHFA